MKYGFKEFRKLDACSLRSLCIAHDWYTMGDCDEYSNLLNKANSCDNITVDILVELASDIFSHSETDYEITDIMHELACSCYSYFEKP